MDPSYVALTVLRVALTVLRVALTVLCGLNCLIRAQVVDKQNKDKMFEVGCEHEEDRAAWIQNILLRRSLLSSPNFRILKHTR